MQLKRRWLLASVVLLALAGIAIVRAAVEPKNDFRFAILGDRTGDAEPGIYEQVWRDVDRWRPDFVINAGDTIQGGNDATADAEWRALRPIWDSYKLPLYFTPGNHDIWSSESRRIYEKATGRPASYSFNYQDAHFTVLDNGQTENLSDQQMKFLEADLAGSKNRDPKFVFFHEPFWLIPMTFRSSEFPFHQLIKKYGVRYVISGHGHQFLRLAQDGVVYVEAGSSSGKLKGQGFDAGWFFGYTQVRVEGSQVDLAFQEVGAPMGKGRLIPFNK
jgi:Icc protein